MEIICCCTNPPYFNKNLWLNLDLLQTFRLPRWIGTIVTNWLTDWLSTFVERKEIFWWWDSLSLSLTCRRVMGVHRSSSWQQREEGPPQTRRTYQLLPLLLRPRPRPLSWHCRDWSGNRKDLVSNLAWQAGWLSMRCSQDWLDCVSVWGNKAKHQLIDFRPIEINQMNRTLNWGQLCTLCII